MYPYPEGLYAARNGWYVAAFSHEVGRTLLERWFLDEPVILFRREDGTAVAMAGRCPHRQFPMAAGTLAGDTVTCGYHGIEFGADGRCVKIPTQERVPPAFGLRTYPIVERWQWLWIWTGDPLLADESLIPDHGAIELGLPDYSSVPMHYRLVNGRYQLLHDNLLDLSHLSYLHGTKIGTESVATTRDEVTAGPDWIRSVRDIRDSEPSPHVRGLYGEKRIDRYLDFTFIAPCLHVGINRISEAGKDGAPGTPLQESVVYHAVTPATKTTCHYFFARTQKHPTATDGQAASSAYIAGVLDEDVFATEQIERMLSNGTEPRDLMTGGDVAVTKGRLMLQRMMVRERDSVPAAGPTHQSRGESL
ncbi:aromatic ring-hydroxylating dioxygenase subunit alpha [soil metagenome]